ncbi:MAG: hypothetical protein GY810_17375 [Aureispira sp.]|nr:hypothetical protein [Aureispira sp.]
MKNVLFLLMTFFVTNLFAQDNVKIEWGEANKNQSFTNRILGETDDEVVTLASKGKDFYIEIYDKQKLSLKNSYEFSLPEEHEKKTEIEKIHFFPKSGKILLFTSLYVKKKNNIYYYEVSLKGKVGKSNLLLEIDVENKRRSGDFGFEVGLDENTILVYHTSTLKKEKAKQIRVKVIDDSFEVVADLEDKIPMKEAKREVFVDNFTFDQNGYIHMLVAKPTNTYTDFFIYTYDSKDGYSKDMQSIILDKDHVIISLALAVNQQQNLVAVGYYMNKMKAFTMPRIQGVFSYIYNPEEQKEVYKKFIAYTDEDYQSAYGKEAKKYKKGIPLTHFIMDIVLADNGEIVLVSESRLFAQTNVMDQYKYQDILVTRMSKDGTLIWLKSIPKRQVFTRPKLTLGGTTGAGGISITLSFSIALMKDKSIYLSYLMAAKNGTYYFIYNDNPKNIITPIDEKPKVMANLDRGVPTLVTIKQDGTMKREVLYGAKNDELILRPRINKKVDENTIYVYGNRKKLDKIGRVELE